MNKGVRPRAAEAHCLIQGRHSVFRLALAAAGGPWPVTAQGRWPALAESQHARSAVRTVWSLSRGQIRCRVVQISAGTLAVPTALSLSPRSLRGHTHAVPHTHTASPHKYSVPHRRTTHRYPHNTCYTQAHMSPHTPTHHLTHHTPTHTTPHAHPVHRKAPVIHFPSASPSASSRVSSQHRLSLA